MSLPSGWFGRLAAPVVAAPMFLTSTPDLVVGTSASGIVGSFPALNQRSTQGFEDWLIEISGRLDPARDAPWGVNLVVHKSNDRLEADLAQLVKHKVPLVITSLGLNRDLIREVQGYGGVVFHDVISMEFAEKAIEAGVDGLIAVTHGAGGHAGVLNPFAFLQQLRTVFDGTLLLGGAVSTGAQVMAARLMGADLAYIGSRFLATRESGVSERQKAMMVDATAEDVILTPAVSGIPANFLRQSFVGAGLDPDDRRPPEELNLTIRNKDVKPWKDLWAAGQGVGAIDDIPAVADLCHRLREEYRAAGRHAAELIHG
ncbi:NAD(P)H-dependent flavin oxidoreductase [Roseovarius sp.]|uniref:NAD(P)H-dependent flavin oxidoreductase n=1 Tax=Roseovarius sp. TaxID=1486281 RepID=UPI003565CC74